MDIDERKRAILRAVVEGYVESAEPVGSRSISKLRDIGLSAATIRNEMGDLEEMGLLEQPHTSAGRVPSQLGYRYYVDALMQRYRMTVDDIDQMRIVMEHKLKELDDILRYASAAFSRITNMTTITSLPNPNYGSIKKIKLIEIDENHIMAVVVTDSGIIKDKKLRIKNVVGSELLDRLNAVLNENLAGMTMNEINISNIVNIQGVLDGNYDMLSQVLEFVYETILESDNNGLFLEGRANILRFPEYNDIEKAQGILKVFDDKKCLGEAMQVIPQTDNVSVIIGGENTIPELKDCSIVLSKYSAGENIIGTIGLIGPTRMDYSKVVSKLEFFTQHLTARLTEEFGEYIKMADKGGVTNEKRDP